MRKLFILLFLISILIIPVNGQGLEAPTVPTEASPYMPYETESFGEGLAYIFSQAIKSLMPDISEGIKSALLLLSCGLATVYLSNLHGGIKTAADMVAVLFSGTVLLNGARSLISLGIDTIRQMDSYSKLLLPVMTTALASEGGISKSAALYGGTTLFSSVLTGLISKIFIPGLYIFLSVSFADRVVGDAALSSIKSFIKWSLTWILKLTLYVFTGFVAVTGVVSGSTDAMTLRATKVTVSGMIPVVGGIISEASEAILVSAGVIKNTAGIYGIYVFLAICVSPVLKILSFCLILKLTCGISSMFASKIQTGLIEDFSQAMHFVLAATGSVCLLLLISVVAFMKGVQ